MTRAAIFLVLLVPVLPMASLAGCSSRTVETQASSRAAGVPVAATGRPSAAPSPVPLPAAQSFSSRDRASATAHRPTRPIPEVIAKAKRFSLADADDRTASMLRTSAELAVPPADDALAPRRIEHAVDGRTPDVAGIGEMMRSYLQAFNRHDPAALAAHWSPTGENLDLDSGETTSGREAVCDVFSALFEEDAGATIDIDVTSIRPLRDDVAVVDGVSRITFTDGTPSSSRFSAVVVRQAGGWMLDTVRESNVPVQAAEAKPLDELAWLLGSWEDVSDGVTASTQCFWSANRSFLIRNHVVTAEPAAVRPLPGDDGIPGLLPAGAGGSREITEIIGWDPDRRQIRSWLFTSSGRFAEGSWSRSGSQPDSHDAAGETWTVRLDGGPAGTDCLYTLTRCGADELSCTCGSDAHAEAMPPACDFVRTARAAAASPGP